MVEKRLRKNCQAWRMNKCSKYVGHIKRVIFGTKTESKEAPWAVPIAVYRYEGVLHCTATLVSSRHIITARHCFVRDFEHGSFRYVFNGEVINKDNCRGEDYIVPPERSEADIHFATRCRDEETCENINLPTNLITRKPALVVLPGLCSGNVLTYLNQDDIAIVELDKDVLFSEKIHPICIDFDGYSSNYFENITIYDFGFDPSDKRVQTGILRYESSYILKCEFGLNVICSYSFDHVQLACKGDSGGGGIMERNGRTTLVAVLSRGEACGEHKRDKADLHMSVWYYSKVICKYTGICKINGDSPKREFDVKQLYGQEIAKPKLISFGQHIQISFWIIFNFLCVLLLS
ncbi:hypothetical protein L3Y34_014433 [Caenorhabditis briggsae]|uniref:Peptidase S1 domain-containing protein n=2 Tax=Caenorhabditis briggsae TaxID=6238 RepID=A0AAE9DQR4_CAEBR|nr:hypothetical protein L3Y34_014433 [Caenorhabditis briggsae]